MFDPYASTGTLPTEVTIVPAVLPKSFDDLKEHCERVRDSARSIQVDVVDGSFAKGKTWPYKDSSTFDPIVKAGKGLPFWSEFDYEFDLMIENPIEKIMEFAQAGASRIIIHAAAPGASEALRRLADVKDDDYGAYSLKLGVALTPDTQPDILIEWETMFDFVQVMGINKVGHQGEPFEPHSIALVERLRRRYPTLPIQVDGAVSLENARALAAAGATRLVVGHDIWEAEDPKAEIKMLYNEANAHAGKS